MSNSLIPNAIYRFTRTSELFYYRAAVTTNEVEFLYPIAVSGRRIARTHENGREYVLLYFLIAKWSKFAVLGYWLNPRKAFEKAYVTDATVADLELVAHDLDDLAGVDMSLDILNRNEIELDLEIWGDLLAQE